MLPLSGWPQAWRHAAAAGAGVLLTFAFAPFNLWPLAVLCPALMMALWNGASPRLAFRSGFCFGVGHFAAGTWWLYISLHTIGLAPVWIAVPLMLAMVALMACYYALLGWLAARLLPERGAGRWLLGLPALWLLMEWWRGWFVSGFPWLSLGYSQTDTWLAAWAPVLGVYGVSALLLVMSGALLALWLERGRLRALAAALLLLPWLAAFGLQRVDWTHPSGPMTPVAIVQGAIPQDQKWIEQNLAPTRALYKRLNEQALGAKLVLWPESAVPELVNQLVPYLVDIHGSSAQAGSDVVMGVMRLADNGRDYYNSMMGLTVPLAFYDKRHLVPFGEYFPVPASVRNWLRLLSLPYSDFTPGASLQPPLRAGGLTIAPTICYEDAFGSAQLAVLREADVLANVTNDSWFGHSPARYQHFQIGRMRAIEAQRYLLRAANDGVSAVVGPRGEVLQRAVEYQPAVLRGTVEPRRGLTPYARIGNWPVILLAMAAAAIAAFAAHRRRRMRDNVS